MKFPIPSPKAGQRRTVKRFAWMPEEMTDKEGNRYTVWLEFFNVIQEYIEGQKYIVQEWVDVERKVNKKGA